MKYVIPFNLTLLDRSLRFKLHFLSRDLSFYGIIHQTCIIIVTPTTSSSVHAAFPTSRCAPRPRTRTATQTWRSGSTPAPRRGSWTMSSSKSGTWESHSSFITSLMIKSELFNILIVNFLQLTLWGSILENTIIVSKILSFKCIIN